MTSTTISKRANANLGIKISRHIISRRLNEINLNCRIACMKPYIFKRNKINWLKFASEHVIWTEEQWDVFISVMGQSLTWSIMTGESSFDAVLKEWYSPQCTKSSVKFGGGSMMVFGMISVLVQDLLSGYTVKLTQL